MQEKAGNSNSRAGSSSGHSSGHMSHRNEITSGNFIAIYCNMNAIMQRSDIYGHTSISLSFLFRKNFKSLKILIIENKYNASRYLSEAKKEIALLSNPNINQVSEGLKSFGNLLKLIA